MENLNLSNEVNVGGRPSVYNAEVAEQICDLIANTNIGLRAICRRLELCYSTVYKWSMPSSPTYRATFRRMYLDAKEMQAAALEEEIMELAGDSSQDFIIKKGGFMAPNPTNVMRCKLQIATKQWMLGRLAAKNKELPEEQEERRRDWFVFGDYFVDVADKSTVDAWLAAEAYKREKQKKAEEEAAKALAPEETVQAPKEPVPYFGGVYPSDLKDVVELPADALVYDEDPQVIEEQLAALREKYAGIPRANGSQPANDKVE